MNDYGYSAVSYGDDYSSLGQDTQEELGLIIKNRENHTSKGGAHRYHTGDDDDGGISERDPNVDDRRSRKKKKSKKKSRYSDDDDENFADAFGKSVTSHIDTVDDDGNEIVQVKFSDGSVNSYSRAKKTVDLIDGLRAIFAAIFSKMTFIVWVAFVLLSLAVIAEAIGSLNSNFVENVGTVTTTGEDGITHSTPITRLSNTGIAVQAIICAVLVVTLNKLSDLGVF